MYLAGRWGTVCSNGWDQKNAAVVCKQLGYSGTNAHVITNNMGQITNITDQNMVIWLSNVRCTGDEGELWKCSHRGWTSGDCGHNKDAIVSCNTGPLCKYNYINIPNSMFYLLDIIAIYTNYVFIHIPSIPSFVCQINRELGRHPLYITLQSCYTSH